MRGDSGEVEMKVLRKSSQSVHVELTKEEMLLINNSLNEICHGINIPEFQTRIGVTKETAERLLDDIGALYDQME